MSSLSFEVCVHPPCSSIHLNKQTRKFLSKDVTSDKNRCQYMKYLYRLRMHVHDVPCNFWIFKYYSLRFQLWLKHDSVISAYWRLLLKLEYISFIVFTLFDFPIISLKKTFLICFFFTLRFIKMFVDLLK